MPDTIVKQTSERRTGRTIHYTLSYIIQGEEHGTDGAIILLQDFPAGAFAWEQVLPQLSGLGRAVYAFDMLGYGLSDHPWPADTSVWGQADALSYLLQQLNLSNVILVGHGLGGAVAQILATRLYRDQTQAIVLIDTLCYQYAFAPNWPLPEMEKRQDFDAPKQTALEDMLRDLRATLPLATAQPDKFKNSIDNYLTPWNTEEGKEVLFQHIRLLIPNYINAVSTDIQVVKKPTLIIWGEKDTIIPLKYGQRLNREISTSQLVVVPNAAHLVLFDAPEAVAQAIGEFVRSL
ncbi:MAG TPA: alpha/beta hydrolase [Ktedonobacteraceae bacterium]